MLSSDFRVMTVGEDAAPTSVKTTALTVEVVSVLVAGAILIGCIYQYRREQRVSWWTLLAIAALGTTWFDPYINWVKTIFVYNNLYINLGTWAKALPGWRGDGNGVMPEPLLFVTAGYIWWIMLFTKFFYASAKWVRSRLPKQSDLSIFLMGAVATAVFDILVEIPLLNLDAYRYVSVLPEWTLWAGKTYQFPIYESIFIALISAAWGMLLYKRDATGNSFAERGVDEFISRPSIQYVWRFMIINGYLSVTVLSYIAAWLCVSVDAINNVPVPNYMKTFEP
jgi:hypothetical protein